jgi:hypothetical protein
VFTVEQHQRAETDPELKRLMGNYLIFRKGQDDAERFSPEQRQDIRLGRMKVAASLAHRYGIRVE